MPADLTWLTARPIAHRGLHGAAIPENSLGAARAAIARGFAIECDVMLSRDRVPFVFHDHDLPRLTGEPGTFGERSADELSALRLKGTDEPIPTVADFLAAVDGAVPVVMELKGTSSHADADMLAHLAPILDGYRGELALMSFDAWLIDQALAYGRRPVGLTAEGTAQAELDQHQAVFDRGCVFVSYNVHHLPNPFVRYVRQERGAPIITWTVRTPIEVAATKTHADQMTFEGFLPQHAALAPQQ
ncbi:glycerophosphodiester phosphodiesterase family protein [Aureimonas leprariae]|uniref:Glycerophosphodiester phosphodiesterase n=1 Tax=Plantimonas leprariae TaxID=2615207 RepID=A0A7V7TY50_9HYPH|nr:glycerophosphodiester phosphodiesterase family protein [Aureimonas leprariae]KAB0676678.1 glycerophosphodiester phosphodiesterase [Aureimonas leprariae]